MRALGLMLVSVVSFTACADDKSASDTDTAERKLVARNSMHSGTASTEASAVTSGSDAVSSSPSTAASPPDTCTEQRWYGDGECDWWCPKGDAADCADNAGVVCAAFFAAADGYCDKNDPCGPFQDEDCQKPNPGDSTGCGGGSSGDPGTSTPPSPGGGDGVCAPKTRSELRADPDCAMLICPTLYSPPDGVCNVSSPCDLLIDADCADEKEPVACIEIAYPKDGKCEAAPGCEANDPDC